MAIPAPEFRWEKGDGGLDMDALLKEFQKFWRENSAVWGEKSKYTEAFPHLLLQAFLQRVLNGGGRIDREYAAGRGRMDLYVDYNNSGTIIEIKLLRDKQSLANIEAKGLEQIKRYRETKAPEAPAYLLIFDRRTSAANRSWKSRLYWKKKDGITIVGC
jgi:predicted house-cleaning noncanonical NTP pyrophosphatase (MazG superfamily)